MRVEPVSLVSLVSFVSLVCSGCLVSLLGVREVRRDESDERLRDRPSLEAFERSWLESFDDERPEDDVLLEELFDEELLDEDRLDELDFEVVPRWSHGVVSGSSNISASSSEVESFWVSTGFCRMPSSVSMKERAQRCTS